MRGHTKHATIGVAAMLGFAAGTAIAADVNIFNSSSDLVGNARVVVPLAAGDVSGATLQARQLDHFNNVKASLGMGALPERQRGVTGVDAPLANGKQDVHFGSNGSARIEGGNASSPGSTTFGNFFLGTAQALNSAQSGVWFNTLGTNNANGLNNIGGNTLVLAFGNNANSGGNFSSNTMIMRFSPGVQGFAFNFADIGDVSGTELVVRWTDGGEDIIVASNMASETGFISLVAEGSRTIEQLKFRQTQVSGQDPNDGFMMYGFSTLTVIPLPPAAWAGLALLGGVAGVRKIRRRG